MGECCLAEHLGRFCVLSEVEKQALAGLETGKRHYRRGAIIRAEREDAGEMFVVERGWLFCSNLLEDGRRQIIQLHLRGDLLGADSLIFRQAPDAITTLTDADVTIIDKLRFGRLFVDQPRLAALICAMMQSERVLLTDRLTSIGRSSARGRVAALLMWIAMRLRQVDPAMADHFVVPMTQEEIGDATGLTAVHVNRTLRVLVEQGLIQRTGLTIAILDRDRLAQIANFIERPERLDMSWLPGA